MTAVRFDAARRPVAEEPSAGHDWCDVFALPGERIAFSVGEVVGADRFAAGLTGEVRRALRPEPGDPASPAEILERVNALVNDRPRPVRVNATVGIVDRATATIAYATAATPAPVLALPCALVQSLPGNDVPLGTRDALAANDWTFTIPPGAYFLSCTSALAEPQRAAGLAAALTAEVRARNAAPAQSLLRRLFGSDDGGPEAAAMIVGAADEAGGDVRLAFSAVPQAVPVARRTLLRYIEQIGLGQDQRYAVIAAAGEALANAVEHAYPKRPGVVRLMTERSAGALCVTVEDDGCWRLPLRSEERGRGIPIMRSLMDAVEVRTAASHTTVALTLYTSPRA